MWRSKYRKMFIVTSPWWAHTIKFYWFVYTLKNFHTNKYTGKVEGKERATGLGTAQVQGRDRRGRSKCGRKESGPGACEDGITEGKREGRL